MNELRVGAGVEDEESSRMKSASRIAPKDFRASTRRRNFSGYRPWAERTSRKLWIRTFVPVARESGTFCGNRNPVASASVILKTVVAKTRRKTVPMPDAGGLAGYAFFDGDEPSGGE